MKTFLKITGIGCLSIIGLFFLFVLIGILFAPKVESSKFSESSNSNTKTEKKVDSAKLARIQFVNDSIGKAKQKRKENAERKLKAFRKKEDEFEGTAFYKDYRAPKYTNINFIYPYIGQKGGSYWLRLQLQYAAENWLFIDRAIFLIDGEKYTISGNFERDNSTKIWEWLDIPVESKERIILDKIAKSKSAKVRYEGSKYYNDRVMTSKEKDIIKKTLEIYDGLMY